jgi:hypothetical protein
MNSGTRNAPLMTAALGLVLGGSLIALEVLQGASWQGAIGGGLIIGAYAVGILVLSRRSETVRAVAGDPVDERWLSLNDKARSFSAGATAVFAVGGFAVTEAMGEQNWQFAAVAAFVGGSYLVGIIWYRWRS